LDNKQNYKRFIKCLFFYFSNFSYVTGDRYFMSFAKETENIVNQLIQAEYENACEQAKKEFNDNYIDRYHSLYEGYAILKEEVEEVKEQIECLDNDFYRYWTYIKANNPQLIKVYADNLKISAEETIKELAQVGAVLQKIRNTIDEVEENE
jgi:hypothetical protein